MNKVSLSQAEAQASTGLHFMKAYNLWHMRIKKCLASCAITHPQFVFLACAVYLAQSHEHVSQAMISAYSDIDIMTVSQLAVLLEKKKLIVRGPNPKDTRAKSIALTEQGKEVLEKSMPLVEEIDREFFAQLGSQKGAFLGMLKQLIGGASKF